MGRVALVVQGLEMLVNTGAKVLVQTADGRETWCRIELHDPSGIVKAPILVIDCKYPIEESIVLAAGSDMKGG